MRKIMKTDEFLKRVAEVLDYEGVILPEQDLLTIDEWDSLGILSVMELLSDLNIGYDADKLGEISMVSELLAMASYMINDS